MQQAVLPMVLFLKTHCFGESTSISFIDSTPIRVCKNKLIKGNRVFRGIAATGKSTIGYFHGFKLNLVVNDKGELLSLMITPGNANDREPIKNQSFIEPLKGRLFADKGYISQTLTQVLFLDELLLITSIRNNMKNVLMELKDKILLGKRSVIETINDELKNICQIGHSRHRSLDNFITNLIAGLIAYSSFNKEPEIKYQPVESNQFAVFKNRNSGLEESSTKEQLIRIFCGLFPHTNQLWFILIIDIQCKIIAGKHVILLWSA